MANMGNRNRTNEVLITEIKKLNEKISSLERTVAEGAVINADATNRNTEQIAQAVVDSSGKTIQATRLQAKASIK
jgi:cell division septum initiation protein DivIVA